ncbi:hypothetical protein PWT90_11025 [Aphanocladium album]|nr:hypothetical protein PWT90_11025 [Aphanocladium album]
MSLEARIRGLAPELRGLIYQECTLGQLVGLVVGNSAYYHDMNPDSDVFYTSTLMVEGELWALWNPDIRPAVSNICAYIRNLVVKLPEVDNPYMGVNQPLQDRKLTWRMLVDVIDLMPQLYTLSITGFSDFMGGNLDTTLSNRSKWHFRDATFCVNRYHARRLTNHCAPTFLHRLRASCEGPVFNQAVPANVAFSLTHLELWVTDEQVEREVAIHAACPNLNTLAIVHAGTNAWMQLQDSENENISVVDETIMATMIRRHNNNPALYFRAVLGGISGLARLALTVPRELALWFAYECADCCLTHRDLRVYPCSDTESDSNDSGSSTEVDDSDVDSDDDEGDARSGSVSVASETTEVPEDVLTYEIKWREVYKHIADHAYKTSGERLEEVVLTTGLDDEANFRFNYTTGRTSSGLRAGPVAKYRMFNNI